MKNIIVYTGPFCNFCDAAKRLLKRNGLSFSEIDVSSGEKIKEEINQTKDKVKDKLKKLLN